MHIPFFGKSIFLTIDLVIAWSLLIILLAIVIIYVVRNHKFPVIWEYMRTTNHRKIGTLYIVFGFLFFMRAGLDALLIRMQLALPNNDFMVYQLEKYNETFTSHGTMMIFFAAMPLLLGLMNIAVPLQIGARDLAFPFLNSLSLWLFVAGGVMFGSAFFLGSSPAVGWTGYAPYSTIQFTPGAATNFYVFGIQIAGFGTLLTALNMIVTIVRNRAPGMNFMRMPLFPWATLVTSFLILIAFTVLAIALYLLMFDRLFGTTFFSGEDGDPVYWQHLFWFFGHPEVYILALPAFGLFSDVISTFSRKKVFGYTAMVVSLLLIGLLGMMVWVHHMFTVGLGPIVNTFFAITTMMIAIPTGLKVFNWLFTMRGGKVIFTVPMLFAIGFIPSFVMGGVTGVMLSVSAANFQFHDTHFVVAHFHYVILASTILGIFSGLYYWYPKITGFKLNETLGKWHFWLFLAGYHMTFLPMHITGLKGMPRRVYTYGSDEGITALNFTSTIGAFLMGISIIIFVINIWRTNRQAQPAGNDPWNGRTMEWSVASPSPEDSFTPMPLIERTDAFWYSKKHNEDFTIAENPRYAPIAKDTVLPFLIAFAVFVTGFGLIYQSYWTAAISGAAVFILFIVRSFNDEREAVYGEGDAE